MIPVPGGANPFRRLRFKKPVRFLTVICTKALLICQCQLLSEVAYVVKVYTRVLSEFTHAKSDPCFPGRAESEWDRYKWLELIANQSKDSAAYAKVTKGPWVGIFDALESFP